MTEHRLARVLVSQSRLLTNWVREGHSWEHVSVTSGVPADAELRSVDVDDRSHVVALTFEHREFEPVPELAIIPVRDVVLTVTLCPAKVQV